MAIRLVDRLPAPEPAASKQLRVMALAGPRTGSTSLGAAFSMLGYRTHVGISQIIHDDTFGCWTEAMEAKFDRRGLPYTSGDFDKVIGRYEAMTGWHAAIFAEELVAAFPDAKVILCPRDADAWVESYNRTSVAVHKKWTNRSWMFPLCNSQMQRFRAFVAIAIRAWSCGRPFDRAEQKAYILDHYERIRKLVPPEQLLEFDSAEGWKPLCRFLGDPEPNEPYPHAMRRDQFWIELDALNKTALMTAAVRGAAMLFAVASACYYGVAVWKTISRR